MKSMLLVTMMGIACSAGAAAHTPPAGGANTYAGQERRALKALSETEIEDYHAGRGMGLSKPAELNRYPGPRHVLDLADKLELSPRQRTRTQAIFDRMQARAKRLGGDIVAYERELDGLFAERRPARGELARIVNRVAALQGELRLIHLLAHVETTALLSREQILRYDAARGYGGGAHSGHAH